MGGFGSGRPWSGKPKVEQASPLNVAKLFRDGHIRQGQGWQTSLIWTSSRDQSQTGSIGFRSWCDRDDEPDRIELYGTYRDKPFSQTIRLVSIPGTKGGKRWFAVCPVTGRRCLKLVLSGRHGGWVSVPASGFRYYSECEDYLGRCRSAIDRAEAKQKRLSKYARQSTRDRVRRELWAAEWRWQQVFEVYAGRLNARLAQAGLAEWV
ncbi:hypothetical protein [Aquidulcibacter sp.]|uniref:hypothetical protein n=1 Tax=Aquidulcibacter sp. TaxID=2052990 RepID=UPI0025BAA693|nr:hypothetical protein [Aquidulcibacter sp.]MCA3692791.1 hypothetical protein [Aquidulcibacter sp.]